MDFIVLYMCSYAVLFSFTRMYVLLPLKLCICYVTCIGKFLAFVFIGLEAGILTHSSV